MSQGVYIGGKYELLRKIASGGMAEVYLAKQTGLVGFEKLVVIKRILPHLSENEEFVRMFLDEARTAADLRHTNVVQIYEVGQDQGTYYIVMEFLYGQDLRRVLRKQLEQRGRVPLQHALQMIIDAAAGLNYAHQKADLSGRPLGIVHRDISPQNIIVTYDGTTKIVDFGIAKAASQSVETRSGVLKGKYSYMSPEQASGEVLDQRTDQFALGIVAYELTTATRLFKYANEIMTLHAIIECRVTPPAHVLRGYPVDLSDIIMRALSKNREDRYPSLADFVSDIEDFMARESMVHSPQRVAGYMQELFAQDIEQESELGHPLIADEPSGTSNIARATARGTIRRQREGEHDPDAQIQPTMATVASRGTPSSSPRLNTQANQLQTQASQLSTAVTQPTAAGFGPSRSSQSKKLAIIGGVIVALLVAVIVGFALKPQAKTGRIEIKTDPGGAKVFVDGREHPGLTPTVVEGLEPGRVYVVKMELFGYDPVQVKVTPEAERPFSVQRQLLKSTTSFGVLKFVSEPPGAKVYIEGQEQQERTPFEQGQLKVGSKLSVVFVLDGYQEVNRSVVVKEGISEVRAQLVKDGQVELASTGVVKVLGSPSKAKIYVDGTARGTLPAELTLEAGSYQVELRAEGYVTDSKPAKLKAGETLKLRFALRKAQVKKPDPGKTHHPHQVDRPSKKSPGSLAVSIPGSWAKVYVDRKYYGDTPLKAIKLSPGRHKVRLENPELGKKFTDTINITPGKRFKLKHSW